jgi:hypothetical protein
MTETIEHVQEAAADSFAADEQAERADWETLLVGWTVGYNLSHFSERTRFRQHLARQTARVGVTRLCQIAEQLGVPNPPGNRDSVLRAIADVVMTRWLKAWCAGRLDDLVRGGPALTPPRPRER